MRAPIIEDSSANRECLVHGVHTISERVEIPDDMVGSPLKPLGGNGPELPRKAGLIFHEPENSIRAGCGGEVFDELVFIHTVPSVTSSS